MTGRRDLRSTTWAAAFQNYQATRLERTARVQLTSRHKQGRGHELGLWLRRLAHAAGRPQWRAAG